MITSRDNKLIKYCLQIKDKKFSRKEKMCLVETTKIVKELYEKNKLTHIFCVADKFDEFKHLNITVDTISSSVAKVLSDTVTTDGVFAICKIEPKNLDISHNLLVLDNIQDPSNMGAIIRSACAFGFDQIIGINSTYPYTCKCIRSSMGHIFNVNYIESDYDYLLDLKRNNNIKLICADMHGCEIEKFECKNEQFAIIIGNEGQGVSKTLKDNADYTISIPMQNNVESLNASVSASIIMYYLKK